MSNEFPKGISIKEARKEAPDFVKGDVGINLKQFVEWAKPRLSDGGWVNLSLNLSAKGNLYFSFYDKNGESNPTTKTAPKDELPSIDLDLGEVDLNEIDFN